MVDVKSTDRVARAERVKTLREMTQLSGRAFERQTGISRITMSHWEDGTKHAIPPHSVNRLVRAMLNLGIHCTYEWVLFGEGPAPEYVQTRALSSAAPPSPPSKQIEQELACFMQQSQDAIAWVVADDAMEPQFFQGDQVAGVRRYGPPIENCIGEPCIVLIKGGDSCLRIVLEGELPGCYHLTHTNPHTTALKPFYYNVELVSAAPVVWVRREDSFKEE